MSKNHRVGLIVPSSNTVPSFTTPRVPCARRLLAG